MVRTGIIIIFAALTLTGCASSHNTITANDAGSNSATYSGTNTQSGSSMNNNNAGASETTSQTVNVKAQETEAQDMKPASK